MTSIVFHAGGRESETGGTRRTYIRRLPSEHKAVNKYKAKKGLAKVQVLFLSDRCVFIYDPGVGLSASQFAGSFPEAVGDVETRCIDKPVPSGSDGHGQESL